MDFNVVTPKVIGDPVHGYVRLTNLEYNLLQLPTMNRLHHIHQTAAAYLTFPGSVTTRFSHVVGALDIGGEIIETLMEKLEENDFKKLFPGLESKNSSVEFLIKSIRLACLFHDIGHGPFSHSAEDAMLEVVRKYHSNDLDEAKQLFDETDESKIPIHEYYTYKLITNGEISDTILSSEDELRDFTADLIVKSENSSISKENPLGYKIIRNIVSSQLDADRMDYLLRDSLMSGVQFGQIDIERIIQNMAIVKNRKGAYHLAIHERALGNIEEMLDARFKMYRYFYNHHTVVLTNELLKFAIDKLINESKEIAELFYWQSYATGNSTDVHILDLLRKHVEEENYLKTKGLIDRRFLPVSIFKSTPDLTRFIREINHSGGFHLDKETGDGMIQNFFQDANGEQKIQDRLDAENDLKDCEIFQAIVSLKPYQSFSSSDRVFLFREQEEELCELSSESRYFKIINQEWEKFKGFYLFYFVPGKKKTEFNSLKNRIRTILATEIANFGNN